MYATTRRSESYKMEAHIIDGLIKQANVLIEPRKKRRRKIRVSYKVDIQHQRAGTERFDLAAIETPFWRREHRAGNVFEWHIIIDGHLLGWVTILGTTLKDQRTSVNIFWDADYHWTVLRWTFETFGRKPPKCAEIKCFRPTFIRRIGTGTHWRTSVIPLNFLYIRTT